MKLPSNETAFSRVLARGISPWVRVYSFEDSSPPSTPDLYCLDKKTGRSFWVELKFVRAGETKLKYQPGQVQWLEQHAKLGGQCFVLYLDEETMVLHHGRHARGLGVDLRARRKDPICKALLSDPVTIVSAIREVIAS